MVSAATTNYGPFALNVSLVASDKATPVTKLTKGQLVYLKVSVTSATGKVISGSGLEASALTDDGYNPLPVTSWDANGYAYIPYTPLCRDTQSGSNITVYVGDLPEDNLYAYAPSDIGTSKPQQRILRLGMSQTLNKQLTYTYN